jgi:HK97 gp10 family phage protein
MFNVDTSELNRIAIDLGRSGPAAVAAVRRVLDRSAAAIERDAKAFCPVDTGFLRNSISRDVFGLTAEVGASASYAAFVEYGTSRTAPRAFLGPAFDRNAPDFVEAVAAAAADGING